MPDQYQYLQGTPGAAAQRLRRQVDALRDCRGPHVFDATDVRLVLEYLEANERARLAEHDAYDRQYEHTGLMPSSRHSSDTDESPTSSRTELRKAWLTGIRVKAPRRNPRDETGESARGGLGHPRPDRSAVQRGEGGGEAALRAGPRAGQRLRAIRGARGWWRGREQGRDGERMTEALVRPRPHR